LAIMRCARPCGIVMIAPFPANLRRRQSG